MSLLTDQIEATNTQLSTLNDKIDKYEMEISKINFKIEFAEANIFNPPPNTDASYWFKKVKNLEVEKEMKLNDIAQLKKKKNQSEEVSTKLKKELWKYNRETAHLKSGNL